MSDFYYDLEQVKSTLKCALKNMYEVCLSSTDLSGYSVNKNYKLGVNITTGKLFYVDEEGDWQPVPTVEGGGFTLEIEDTDTVDLSGEGTEANPLKADVKIDPDEDNLLSSTENGLLVTYEETDPTVGDHIKNITTDDIADWGEAYSWGDHSIVGYLLSETDPTVAAHIKAITNTDITNWNTAFGWGNHATMGYLTSIAAAGSNTQIQFNNSGVLGADSNLYWDNVNKMLYASSAIANTTLDNIVTSKRVRCQGVNVLNNSSYMAGILRSSLDSFAFDVIGYGNNHSQVIGTFGTTTYNLSLYGNRYIDLGTGVSSSALKILTSFVSAANSLGIGDVRVIDNQPTINVTDLYSPNFVGYYYNPTVGNLNAGQHIAAHIVSGDVIIGDLAGVGNRMVVAEADGKLNTQAIPTQINNTEYAEAAYTGSITWTGSSAPSGTENHRQIGQSVNKRMSVDIRLQYTTNGAGLTAVVLALPATYPAPKLLNGVSMTPGKVLYPGTAIGARTDTDASISIGRTFLVVNSAGTWYDIQCVFGSSTVGYLSVSIEYPIN